VLCADSSDETVEHLFLKHGFTKECWFRLGLTVDDYLSPFQVLESFRFQLALPFFYGNLDHHELEHLDD